MTAKRADLHNHLNRLLDAADADGGRLDMDDFWHFVAALAQGRGITEALHSDGLEGVCNTPNSPANTLEQRKRRAYHIAVTAHLLAAAGRLPGQGSILPPGYNHGVVVHDLLGMLGGNTGQGEADPQILTSMKKGKAGLRRAAQRRLVGVVYWRMGRTGKTRAEIWDDLMGLDAEKSKIDRWQRECGGPDGWLCQTALAAGKADQRGKSWDASNEELADVIRLVRSGPGKRGS